MLRLGRRTRRIVRRHLPRRGTRRAIRPRICPDWRWAARRSGNESPAGRALRWPTMAKDRRILPRPQTFEAKLACVIGERCGNVHGEEHRRNLTDHVPSLPQMTIRRRMVILSERSESKDLSFASRHAYAESSSWRAEHPCGDCPSLILRGGVARAGSIFRCILDSSATSYPYLGARFPSG